LITQSGLLTVLIVATIAVLASILVAVWYLLSTVRRLAERVDGSLREVEKLAEDVRQTNAVFHGIVAHAERSVANVEHVTEGVRNFRKTLDAATGVLNFAVVPVLGNVAGVLAGSKAAVSHLRGRISRKEGRHHGE
jgi:uncharacterized protein YoxC